MSARSRYDFWLCSCCLPTIAELFLSINYHNKSCGDRTIIAVSPYGARSTCLQATVLRFLKICKSADYYKVVEAMMIVEHRRVIHDNRRPNVTYALVIVVIDVRMIWALRPLDNLGRTEARPRLNVPFQTLEKHYFLRSAG